MSAPSLQAFVVITEWNRPHDLNGSYTLEGVALTREAADSIAAGARAVYQGMGRTEFGPGEGQDDDSEWDFDIHVEERDVDVMPRATLTAADRNQAEEAANRG